MRANLQALTTLRTLQQAQRPATPPEQVLLARWSGWGAVPEVFDPAREEYGWARAQLTRLLAAEELAAAARNTLNAHYTDAELVKPIWAATQALGFAGGRVLEPGCGSGNFIAFAPADAQVFGVELEPITAAIAQALYPDAQIWIESFADTRAPEGSFDLVVGNVPFGKVTLTDRRHNAGGHSIHNHFIVKSLHLTRPGGLVAVLTSRYTLDARNPAARREIAELADLVGAVRLPTGAHRQAAGTQAVTDLLILRRREPQRARDTTAWERARPVDLPGGQVAVNEYFLDHPEAILGELSAGSGLHGTIDLRVEATSQPATALAEALDRVTTQATDRGLTFSDDTTGADRPTILHAPRSHLPEGYLQIHPAGRFTQISNGQPVPFPVPSTQAAELLRLLGLRDTVVALLDAESASVDDTPEIQRLREQLNRRYDTYLKIHGPLNRFSWRPTGRVDPATGQERMARVRPPQGRFRTDPFAPAVYALEHFDPTDQHATKASIFDQRVIARRTPRLGADTPADALAISLDTYGEVRVSEVARLLGVDEVGARAALGTLVFDDPEADRVVPAAAYLSGNVRAKLAAAREAAARDPRYGVNVEALTAVTPKDLGPGEIAVRLGASWIGERYVQQFLREILDDEYLQVEHPGGSTWAVRGSGHSVLATSTWGTTRVPAPQLAQAVLEQRLIRVHDELPEGKRILNLTETVAAQEKAQELQERFAEWAWEDPERASDLARTYNDRFNAIALRSYDDVRLSLPGLAISFKPHPHQVAGVARIIHEPAVLLAHEVGAGKTAEMAMGAMELRRLGFVNKPAFVVPNHMLEQFAREFLQLYPQARILVATKEDLQQRDGRRTFVARCATGDWDAVILSRSAFERIPLRPEAQRAYLDRELEQLRGWVERSKDGKGLTVKRLERTLLQAQERIKAKLDGAKDPGVTFEQTGIDYLFVDEAHAYKNLRTPSNIPNVAIDGSQRASDIDMKIDYLRHQRGERVVTFATATPIANSVAEAYVMQRFLRPDVLTAAGLEDFDSWAATFGEVTTGIELAPDGGRFRLHSRFARFRNVPELLRMWHLSADIKTAEDLKLPTPTIVGGSPETVVIEPSPELLDYVAELGERADDVKNRVVDPSEDNMLKIATDGRKAALDMRLVGRHTDAPGKAEAVADRVAALWAKHRDDVYLGPDGREDPVRGSLQLVFCDLSTPAPGWNFYDELRNQLIARGLPGSAVRFVHSARNDREKAELFAACRAGRVAVLVGSTERMGVGTNVQTRAVALHDVDCPWKPAEVHQRAGRVLRQGNQNPEVHILRYVTERSFDGYSWQTVERKARFIAQVMRGRFDVREIEDIGDAALSYSEVKALAAGDPRLLQKAQADAELTRLERLERAWARSQDMLSHDADRADWQLEQLTTVAEQIDGALARRVNTRGDAFRMQVQGTHFDKRAPAGERLQSVAIRTLTDVSLAMRPHVEVGYLGGFPVTVMIERQSGSTREAGSTEVVLQLTGVPRGDIRIAARDLREANPTGLVTRLENRLLDLERLQRETQATIETVRVEQARARQTIGRPFPHQDQLAAAREQVRELAEALQTLAKEQDEPTGDEQAHEPSGSQYEQDRVASPVEPGLPSPSDAAPWSTTMAPADQHSVGDAHDDLAVDFDS